jgi:hypothetical protein
VPPNSETLPNPSSFLSQQVESSRVFFFDEPDPAGFEVKCGGFERCRPDYRIDRSDFPWFVIEFVHGGRGTVTLNGVEAALKSGVFFVYGPGVEHHIVTDPEKPLLKYFSGFAGPDAADFLKRHEILPGMVSHCLKSEPIRRAFDTLLERGSRNSRYSRPLCTAIIQQLLLMAQAAAGQRRVCVYAPTGAVATYIHTHTHTRMWLCLWSTSEAGLPKARTLYLCSMCQEQA